MNILKTGKCVLISATLMLACTNVTHAFLSLFKSDLSVGANMCVWACNNADSRLATIQLLKDEKYNELISFGNSKEGRMRIYYIGDDSSIGEFVVFTTSLDIGFAVIRVLGNEMNLSEIMQLGPIIDKLDSESLNVDDFFDFML